jgi:hypothetical protein
MTNLERINLKLLKLEEEFEQYKRESIKWSWEDFVERAKDTGYKCSRKEAQTLLEEMIRKHDCEIGITWFTLDYYLQTYCKKKK